MSSVSTNVMGLFMGLYVADIQYLFLPPAVNILLILPGSLSPSHLNSLDSEPGRRDLSGAPLQSSQIFLFPSTQLSLGC